MDSNESERKLSDGQLELVEKYHCLNRYARKGQILFVGSSLMEYFPLNELAMSFGITKTLYNRGIGGFTTADLIEAADACIFELEPSVIFINIGTNDIGSHDYTQQKLLDNYRRILCMIKEKLPDTKVYVMAYYPVNAENDFGMPKEEKESMFKTRTNSTILKTNIAVKKLAEELGYTFINVNYGLTDDRGNLKREYTLEGIHMNPHAYAVVLKNLERILASL